MTSISEQAGLSLISYSITPWLYTPIVKWSDILSDKSLGELVWRNLATFGRHFDFFVTSTIHQPPNVDVRRGNVVFTAKKRPKHM